MAELRIEQDPAMPGAIIVRSAHAGALAATCDTLVEALGGPTDALAVWGLHPHEQDELREQAYLHERAELGHFAQVQVVELARPRERNVVWIDRYHLVATGAQPPVGTRILGLYAGGGQRGTRCALYVHDASVTGMVAPHLQAIAEGVGEGWDDPALLASVRFALLYSSRDPGAVHVRVAMHQVPATLEALHGLAGVVAHWN